MLLFRKSEILNLKSQSLTGHIYFGNDFAHGLGTHNEGINQRNLKFWTDVADKVCFGRT